MKKYLSVFEMIARSSIYKVLLILAGMVAVEVAFFYQTMTNPGGLNIEEYIDESYYAVIFKVAYILITVAVVLYGMNIGSMQSYTLQRLRIKEKKIFWLQAIYNIFAYVLLWGTQLAVILGSAVYYQNHLPEGAAFSNQTLFLAFYRNNFMHSILPLEESVGWWVLIFVIVGTGMTAASCTKQQRHGKLAWELLIVVATVLIAFPRALGYEITFMAIAAFVVAVAGFWRWALNREVKES